jgi:hypothetical protein
MLLSLSLGTAAGAFYKSSRVSKKSDRANEQTSDRVYELEDQLKVITGRMLEQREIYGTQFSKMQHSLGQVQQALITERTNSARFLKAWQLEQQKNIKLTGEIERLTGRVQELEQQITFFLKERSSEHAH